MEAGHKVLGRGKTVQRQVIKEQVGVRQYRDRSLWSR